MSCGGKFVWLFLLLLLSTCGTLENGDIIQARSPIPFFFSPGITDGIRDELLFTQVIPAIQDLRFQKYQIQIKDRSGRLLNSFDGGGSVLPPWDGSVLPPWDGRERNGEPVPEGFYECTLTVWNLLNVKIASFTIAAKVDNTPPRAELFTSYRQLSPNGDGHLDTILFSQKHSSEEDLWTGIIKRGNKAVANFRWHKHPGDLIWAGDTEDGSTASDGVYTYELSSVDKAGNAVLYAVDGITVEAKTEELRLSLGPEVFSPNQDGVRDVIKLSLEGQLPGRVSRWELRIIDQRGTELRSYDGRGSVPKAFEFDGNNSEGKTFEDGSYRGILAVVDDQEKSLEAASEFFIVDTTAPVAIVNTDYPLFSPDSDGRRDTITLRQTAEEGTVWRGELLDLFSKVLRTYTWENMATSFEWDGKDGAGRAVPDGIYAYRLSGRDEAGNSTTTVYDGLRVDTGVVSTAIKTTQRSFSPNGDGLFDTAYFTLSVEPEDGIREWRATVKDKKGQSVRVFTDPPGSPIPTRLIWDGTNGKRKMPDGSYAATVAIEYWKGAIAENSAEIVIDTTGPAVAIRVAAHKSPDTIAEFHLTADDPSGISQWSLQIFDPAGNILRRFSGKPPLPKVITWDGFSAAGKRVHSLNPCTFLLTVRDNVANITTQTGWITVGIVMEDHQEGEKIIVSGEPNGYIFDRIVSVAKIRPTETLRIEGHADIKPGVSEIQLVRESTQAAMVFLQALVERGISPDRLSLEGFGSARPIVPFDDRLNSWKNSRIEIILRK